MHKIQQSRLLNLILFYIILIAIPQTANAEGSGEWYGVGTGRMGNLWVGANNTGFNGYGTRGYMMLPSGTSGYEANHRPY